MAKETQLVQISGYLFLLGVIIALIAGIVPSAIDATTVAMVELVLGTIIGLLAMGGWAKLTADEEKTFLIATIALIVAGTATTFLGGLPTVGEYLGRIFGYIQTLVAPAAVLIALIVLWRVGAGKLRLGR
ncbi:MAG: hypothetical protein QW751_02875 [Candidatus Aenigmatarchaeota archaeon]|nr:hypothetical protein [Candidatus Aenigmarchaeota archaeon]